MVAQTLFSAGKGFVPQKFMYIIFLLKILAFSEDHAAWKESEIFRDYFKKLADF